MSIDEAFHNVVHEMEVGKVENAAPIANAIEALIDAKIKEYHRASNSMVKAVDSTAGTEGYNDHI